jgi:Protein of unknown function (DUF4238)
MTKEAKAAPRRQHFVPQFYLRGFVGETGMLFVIDRPSKKSFRTPPKNVAAERDFNRVDVEGMDPNAIEKDLAEFESKVAPALKRVKAAKSLDDKKDRDAAMNLICALAIRNPRQRARINDFVAELMQRAGETIVATKEQWESLVRRMKAAGIGDDSSSVPYEEMKKFIKERRYKIEVRNELNVSLEIDEHDSLLQYLSARRWQILVANEGSGGFVTTDVPVCITWLDGQGHWMFPPGFGLLGTQVIFPISTNLALRGTFEGEENVVDADIFTVASINSILISNAEKQIYAHDHSFNYLKPFPQEIGNGATLVQDEKFLAGAKEA